jgi:two-component system sensor histidine kinase KdpD
MAAAWQQLLDTVAQHDTVFHGDSGAHLDPAALRPDARVTAEDEAVAVAALLARQPRAVLMPTLVGSVRDGVSRWERTQSLLVAGVAVYAPLDVTELASLAQTTAAITGRRPVSLVSDSVLQRADQIVWVDPRNAAQDSTASALRTLALRCLAAVERSDDRSAEAAGAGAVTTVLAVIGPDEGDKIVAVAARLARQLESRWEVIYAQPPGARYTSTAAREAVQRTLKLAARMGARTATIPCLNIAEAVAQYVRAHHSRHVVTGIHTGGSSERWPQRLVELEPDVELTLVPVAQRAWHRNRVFELLGEGQKPLRGYAVAIAGCAALTVLGLLARGIIEDANIVLLYLLLVFIVGRSYGRYPAALSSLIGSWAFYYYFVPPGFERDPQYLLTFAVMFTVALITGNLTAGLRHQSSEAVTREARTRALYELAQALSGVLTREEVAVIAERIMAGSFKVNCSLLCPDGNGRLQPAAGSTQIVYDAAYAQQVFEASDRRQAPPDEPEGPLGYLPLRAPVRTRGVLVFELDERHWQAPHGGQSDLDACVSVIAIALERIHYVEISQQALLRIESERLRNSLLTAISHDLRTPLTALVGLAESMRLAEGRERLMQAIDEICDEAGRLSRLVDNLLDMARLQTGAIKLRLEWQSIEEIVGCALYSLRFALHHHRVETRIPAELPLLRCDASLIERVIANLLENAAKYVPPGGRIHISAEVSDDWLQVRVEDDGPGVNAEVAIFDKFSRGNVESAIPGVGLGLAICRSIVEAHGGQLWQQRSAAGGAAFHFSLPLIKPPPAPDVAAVESSTL